MPTKKPRVYVTLSPEAHHALTRFADVSGVAASQFIRSIVDDSIPVIEAMTKAYEMAKKAPTEAVKVMESELVRAMSRSAQMHLEMRSTVQQKPPRRRPRKSADD